MDVLDERAQRRREQLTELIDTEPTRRRPLSRELARILDNYPGKQARAQVWAEITHWVELIEKASVDGPGMFDDLGDDIYGPVDIELYVAQMAENLAAELTRAACAVLPRWYSRRGPAPAGA